MPRTLCARLRRPDFELGRGPWFPGGPTAHVHDPCVFEQLLGPTSATPSANWLYLIAAAFCFAEAALLVGMVLPERTALLVAGVFCQRGPLNLWVMWPWGSWRPCRGFGGFEFGKKYGPSLRRSRMGVWVGERRWTTVDAFIHRHGGKAVFLGRLTALFRALVPSMAGMSGMRYRTFIVWNLAGG